MTVISRDEVLSRGGVGLRAQKHGFGAVCVLLICFLLYLFDFSEHICCQFVDGLSTVVESFFIGRPSLSENFKSEDQWLIRQRPVLGVEVRVSLKEDICEADAKVSSINVQVLLARHVDFLAAWAENFNA
jgi:hypothetical protein